MEAHGYLPYYLNVKSTGVACDVSFLHPLNDDILCLNSDICWFDLS